MIRLVTPILLSLSAAAVALAQPGGVKTFQHPSGVAFQYPAAWELRQDKNDVALLPADLAKDDKGQPLELFLLSSEPAPGIQSAADPRVVAFFDERVPQLFPGAKRIGEPEPLATAMGSGAVLTFEAAGPGGISLRQRVYVLVHEGTGVFLAHIARKDLAARRDEAARKVFASFKAGERQVDPALLHTWRGESFYRSADANSSLANSTYVYWRFLPDGSVLYSTRSHIFGDTEGLAVTVSGDSSSGVSKGRYGTQNGVLTIAWDDGTHETYEYNVFKASFDGSLNLGMKRPNDKKKKYFTLIR